MPARSDLKLTANVCQIHATLKREDRWWSVNELAEAHSTMSLGTVKNVIGALVKAGLVRCVTVTHPWQYRIVQADKLDLVHRSQLSRLADAQAVFEEKRAAVG